MLIKRSYLSEIIDDFSITDERIDQALIELRVINRYLGGNSTSMSGIKTAVSVTQTPEKLKILDLGAGASELFDNTDCVSIDLNIEACRFDRKNNPSKKIVCCDAFMLPFKPGSFQIIHASLFLHHFREDEIVRLINNISSITQHAIIINDLRRSVFAFLGIKLLTFLFSGSEMVKNDGPLSVKRGFVKKELQEIISHLNFKTVIIKRKWAFRWMVSCLK